MGPDFVVLVLEQALAFIIFIFIFYLFILGFFQLLIWEKRIFWFFLIGLFIWFLNFVDSDDVDDGVLILNNFLHESDMNLCDPIDLRVNLGIEIILQLIFPLDLKEELRNTGGVKMRG